MHEIVTIDGSIQRQQIWNQADIDRLAGVLLIAVDTSACDLSRHFKRLSPI